MFLNERCLNQSGNFKIFLPKMLKIYQKYMLCAAETQDGFAAYPVQLEPLETLRVTDCSDHVLSPMSS